MNHSVFLFAFLLFCHSISLAYALPENKQPIEIGVVEWGTDFDKALERSGSENKPIFALFQEVPGCSGCKQFGQTVLSEPLLVEAIESEFIPTVIFNNRTGKDAALLKRFGEPSWNFQVVRFFDSSAKDIIPRKDRVWTVGPLARRMVEVLRASGKNIQPYLQGIALQVENPHLKEAAFSMHCYWTGEMEIGAIDGVVATEAGHYQGREVTRIWYDSSSLSLPELAKRAAKVRCANTIYVPKEDSELIEPLEKLRLKTGRFNSSEYQVASKSDQKKQLQGTPFESASKSARLTTYQLTKINAFIRRDKQRALSYLSPRQRRGS